MYMVHVCSCMVQIFNLSYYTSGTYTQLLISSHMAVFPIIKSSQSYKYRIFPKIPGVTIADCLHDNQTTETTHIFPYFPTNQAACVKAQNQTIENQLHMPAFGRPSEQTQLMCSDPSGNMFSQNIPSGKLK